MHKNKIPDSDTPKTPKITVFDFVCKKAAKIKKRRLNGHPCKHPISETCIKRLPKSKNDTPYAPWRSPDEIFWLPEVPREVCPFIYIYIRIYVYVYIIYTFCM